MIEFRHLRLLTAVADNGSLSAAARALGLSQPAVTQQMQGLEKTLGTPLLVRAKGRVQLTETAQMMVERARPVLEEMSGIEKEVESMAGLQAGRLRLACFPSAASTLLPSALAAMRRDYPGITFSLVEAGPRKALDLLREGSVDIAIVNGYRAEDTAGAAGGGDGEVPEYPDHLGVDELALESGETETILLEEHLWVALPEGHPLADENTVDLADLADAQWIAGCPQCRAHLMAAAGEAGFVPEIVFETDDHNALQELTAAGLGVALVTDLMVAQRSHHSGYVLRPTSERRVRRVGAVTSTSVLEVPGVQETLDALRVAAERLALPELSV